MERAETPLRHSRATRAVLLIVAAVLCLLPVSQSEELTEYQVKAAFIYNFAKFVEWPAEAFLMAMRRCACACWEKTLLVRNSCGW